MVVLHQAVMVFRVADSADGVRRLVSLALFQAILLFYIGSSILWLRWVGVAITCIT